LIKFLKMLLIRPPTDQKKLVMSNNYYIRKI
jgi:hypothetical protein